MKHIFAAALAGALINLPMPIFAQTEGPHGAMGADEATMVCRPAAAKEKATAMMGDKGLVCKSLSGMMTHGKMMMPSMKGMDQTEAAASLDKWLREMLLVKPSAGTASGNNG